MPLFILGALLGAILSTIIILSTNTTKIKTYYVAFNISIILWMIGAIVARLPEQFIEPIFRSLFAFAAFTSMSLLLFVNELIGKSFAKRTWVLVLLLLVFFSIISIATPYVTKEATLVEGIVTPARGPLYLPAAAFIILLSFLAIHGLTTFLSRKNISSAKRRQVQAVLLSTVLSVILAILLNLIVPAISGQTYAGLAPLSLMTMSIGFGYSIIRHGLFDIRAVIARAVAYVMAIGILIFVFVGAANLIQVLFSPTFEVTATQFILNIAVTMLLVLLYPHLKKYFDKITNRVFFQDAYDAQSFLDDLNKTLVSYIDVEVLLQKSCELIEQNIKSEFASFYALKTSYSRGRLVGDAASLIHDREAIQINELMQKSRRKVLYIEYVDEVTSSEKSVVKLLKKKNIDILVRIVNTLGRDDETIGYLLLGQKRSGNPYNSQDLKVLEIVGNELELAVENALRFEEIQQFNVTLQKKIDDATKELKRNNEKLKALDEAKDEFVSMASHQLRTPLTSIKGYVSMVLDGDGGKINAQQKKMLNQALFSSQRMVYLISDLLNVSRLQTGKFIIEPSTTQLTDVVASEIEQVKEGAAAKNITVSYKKPKDFPLLNLDEVKIRQVIMNLLDNAIYYTPTDGKIVLELTDGRSNVEFRVKDSGIGVPKSEQHKLFTKFYRAGNARKARPDGTGLGLFMVKKVIVAQGGSVIFESKEGKGSTFGFSFPKAKLEIPEDKSVDGSPKDVKK